MPTYTYECKDCNHQFEITQRMSDDTLTFCPACDKESLERIIVAAPTVHVPLNMQASPDKFKYHGINDPIKGE